MTPALLEKRTFLGPSIGIEEAGGSFAAESMFCGHIAFFLWTREELERSLPADLELARARHDSPAEHPVLLLLGEQTEGAWILAGRRIPVGFRYREAALAIPFVKHRAGRYLHTHVPRMYASYQPVVWNDRANYGLGKRLATLTAHGPFHQIVGEDGAAALSAVVEPRGDWRPAPGADGFTIGALREICSLPIVGRTARGFVCSYFDWNFAAARVRPVSCALSIDAPLVDGPTPRWCHDVPGASLEVAGMGWRLSWPLPCRF